MQGPIIIDPAKIEQKIRWHQAEAKRLAVFLDGLDDLREFAIDSSTNGNGRGRPAKGNPLIEPLRKFVESRHDDFTHKQLKTAIGDPPRRDQIRDAIRALEEEGVLKVVEFPMGRNPGKYRTITKEEKQT